MHWCMQTKSMKLARSKSHFFGGQGTLWIPRFEDPSHPMNPLTKKSRL